MLAVTSSTLRRGILEGGSTVDGSGSASAGPRGILAGGSTDGCGSASPGGRGVTTGCLSARASRLGNGLTTWTSVSPPLVAPALFHEARSSGQGRPQARRRCLPGLQEVQCRPLPMGLVLPNMFPSMPLMAFCTAFCNMSPGRELEEEAALP